MKFLVVFLMIIPVFSFGQIKSVQETNEIMPKKPSNYTLGFNFGYSGVFINSPIMKSELESDFVNGLNLGFLFEYKIKDTKTSVIFISETNSINIDFADRVNNNVQIVNLNMLGIKAGLGFADGVYILPALGIMTGIETQFIRSLNIGYDFTDNNKRLTYFYQLGYTITDNKDGFLGINLGVKFNL